MFWKNDERKSKKSWELRKRSWFQLHGQELHEHVERLPEQEREVFGLLFYEGLAQAEAARVLGVSVPTVKRLWRSARLRLHRQHQLQ